jgi:hypothetical protein
MFVVLTETWLSGESLDAEMLPVGYKVFARMDRPGKGGGVLILGLELLLVNPLSLDEYYTPYVAEIVGVEYKGLCIFGAYTQSSESSPLLFDSLSRLRESAQFAEKTSVFLMDANAHHEEWLGSRHTDDAGHCALAFSEIYEIEQCVDFPTRKDNILDLVYSDRSCVTSALPHLGSSDHVTVLAKINMSIEVPVSPPNRSVWHWASAPWNHMRGGLRVQLKGWSAFKFESVDDAVEDFYSKVDTIMCRFVKRSMVHGARPAPWWDRHCTVAQQHVDAAFALKCSNPDSYDSARRVLKTRQRQAYARYRKALKRKLERENGGKEWWRIVKLHAGKGGSRTSGAPSPDDLAEYFAKKLSLDGKEQDPVPEFTPVLKGKLTSFRVTRNRVKKVLNSLNPHKSMNGISNRFLKECSGVLCAAVTTLFQRVARDAVWPKRWKEGRVSPIWKRESRSLAKNYRPVTVLDCLSLCMERVLDPQFDAFILKFIPDSQYGFRKRCGAQDYGAALCMKLHAALERNMEAILVSLDVAGAFDKVWWAALLKNLWHCGCRGRAHKLMRSYLCARFLCVVALGEASKRMEFFCGVPQGAIWSPKLWNFFMRELPSVLNYTEDFNYADDSALLKIFEPVCTQWTVDHFSRQAAGRHQAMCEINEDLEALHQFGLKWKVTFEPSKTHALLVSNTKDAGCFPLLSQLVFGSGHVVFEPVLLLVGFLFDSKLTWEPMVKRVSSKARRALGAVRGIRKLVSSSDFVVLYKAFVRSVLEYGMLGYIAAAPSHLAKMDRIQESAERVCGVEFPPLSGRRDAAAFGLLCKLLDGECIGQLQDLCPKLSVEEPAVRCTRSVSSRNSQGPLLKLGEKGRARLDSSNRSLGWQMDEVLGKVPQETVTQGLKEGWRAAMKSGQRALGGSSSGLVQETKIQPGQWEVQRVIGAEESSLGRRYKVVWLDFPGKDSWEREENLAGAEKAVSEFWIMLGEPTRSDSKIELKAPKPKPTKKTNY